MDLNAVQMFVTIVQAGSLSAAARQLGVPLPTLSRKVAELERELHVQLLERSVRGATVTQAGGRLYDHASGGIEALQDAKRALLNEQAQLRGRLRLSLPQSFEPWWDLIGAFQSRYPDIQVSVHATERRVDLIADGIDVALRVGDIAHETVVAKHILSIRHVLVASPALVARLGLPSLPADLGRYPCAAWGSAMDVPVRWTLGGHVQDVRPVITVNDYVQIRARVLSGHVVAELPPFLAAAALQDGKLVQLLADQPLPESPIHLVYRQHRHPSSIVRAYLAFCQSYLPVIRRSCQIWPMEGQ